MWNLRRTKLTESKLKKGLILKLSKVPITENLRWVDNIHTGLGMNVQELRKSLTRDDPGQALVYIEDIRVGAVSLLASMEVMGSSLDPNWKTDL
jgi:hypothetical protein